MDVLARLEQVTKVYPRVHRPGERLRAFAALLAGHESLNGAEVLKDIDLEVFRGQSLGIIGENGAGKSTLLKVLTGVIQPSRGAVEINARTAALLELGAGFQPEFSGLDNVRMKAAILGMSQAQLKQRLDEILAFADIGEYIHEPVKHYSSGMVVRLGFAVVTASRPELLITDEVLAVGDESFQKKCVRWLQHFLERGGTLLMVSHSMYLVQKLCQRAMWLHQGAVHRYGEVFEVTQDYLAWHEHREAEEKEHRDRAPGDDGHYRVSDLRLLDPEGDEVERIAMGTDLDAELVVYSPDTRMPACMIGISRIDGTPVYGLSSDADQAQPERMEDGLYRFRIRFPEVSLLPGNYVLQGYAMDPEGLRVCDAREVPFRISGRTSEFGFVRLRHQWTTGGSANS